MRIARYTLNELETLPTLCVGQADNLKVEGEDNNGRYRIWLSRCGIADGEPYENKVTVERCDSSGQWFDSQTYPAKRGSE